MEEMKRRYEYKKRESGREREGEGLVSGFYYSVSKGSAVNI